MGIRKELKRIGQKTLKQYEAVLHAPSVYWPTYSDVKEFLESNGIRAADFPSELIHKNLKVRHEEVVNFENIEQQVLSGNFDEYKHAVINSFDDKSKYQTKFRKQALREIYSKDDTSVGCQKARTIYADELQKWSNYANGSGPEGLGAGGNNTNTALGMYHTSMKNLVNSDHIDEAKEMFQQYKASLSFSEIYAHGHSSEQQLTTIVRARVQETSAEEDKNFAGFIIDQMSKSERSYMLNDQGREGMEPVTYDKVIDMVSPETQAELLELYVKKNTNTGCYPNENAQHAIIESLKTEDGTVTLLTKKAFEHFENNDLGGRRSGNEYARQVLTEEIRKGNSVIMDKHFKDTQSFARFYNNFNVDGEMHLHEFAQKLAFDEDGNESKAKPKVVEVLLDNLKSVSEKEGKVDLQKEWQWMAYAGALEAVTPSDSVEDLSSRKELGDLMVQRSEGNIEYYNNLTSRPNGYNYETIASEGIAKEQEMISAAKEKLEIVENKLAGHVLEYHI